ncbi:hypothetical protein [Shewanella putrefaciens]|uniref:hypothetical protein n=1 Tax=Shewanella putrefaciens TaxID=24 RepID=UPI002856F29D|nr:hypothetical protein [Shewanella putrefaciens]MDR6962231.1 hypothetical protein [Shewanella putrefaciens]
MSVRYVFDIGASFCFTPTLRIASLFAENAYSINTDFTVKPLDANPYFAANLF